MTEARRKLYLKRLENHQCQQCGKTDERTESGKVICEECAEKRKKYRYKRSSEALTHEKEWRALLREAHLCRTCKKQDAYTLKGRTYCAECAEKMRLKKQESKTPEKLELMRVQSKEYRDKWRESGCCTRCGHKLNNTKYRTCLECRTRTRIVRKEKRTSNYPRGGNGICWQCNKKPVLDGKKLCEACYLAKVGTLKAAWAIKPENHPWRLYMINGRRYGE